MINFSEKIDTREQKDGWFPGHYIVNCSYCKLTYMGHKRSNTCGDCAYDEETDTTPITLSHTDLITKSKIENDIMNVLIKHMNDKHTYINPNFLSEVTRALNDYYSIENVNVDSWVSDMYGA